MQSEKIKKVLKYEIFPVDFWAWNTMASISFIAIIVASSQG
jgi:hypothetical protein